MDVVRRRFLRASAAATLLAARVPARAAAYPSRPVHWIVPFAPGGGTDIVARVLGEWLSARLGEPFLVENRPGAGANIGTEAVVRAPADGHTLLLAASANAINATLYRRLPFDFLRDIAPVAGIIRVPNVMVVHPAVPAADIEAFIRYARSHPGTVNFASAGTGTTQHVAGELFKMMAGIDMTHVPYRGTAPALVDLLAGRVQAMFLNPASAAKYIHANAVRALGVTSAGRCAALPALPAIGEILPGFEATLFYGLAAPRGTPASAIATLNREINAGLAEPSIRKHLDVLDGVALAGTPEDFGRLLAEETAKWRRVIEAAKIEAT